jgi:uncharacterized membrane protein
MASAPNPAASVVELARPARVESVDLWRGVVMVIMALDHVRDYMTHLRFPPEILELTNGPLFFTRWMTHLCAPAFFFLAGTGIFLASRTKSSAALSKFLWTRGLFLIAMEFTIIWWGWTFLFPYPGPVMLVIWALGMSMVIMSELVRLPVKWVAVLSIAIIAGHNLLDWVKPEMFGKAGVLWGILHVGGFYPLGGVFPTPQGPQPIGIFVLYPLLPWAATMAAGYAFGTVFSKTPEERQRWMWRLGFGAIALFFVLRATNIYGNAAPDAAFMAAGPFVSQAMLSKSVIAFFNVAKYPPSFQFLLITLGIAIVALAASEKFQLARTAAGRFFTVFGKVPMFYYILHVYLAHLIAIVAGLLFHQPVTRLLRGGFMTAPPDPGFGFNLPAIYAAWVILVLILYFPCRWYARYKSTHKQWWLGYL